MRYVSTRGGGGLVGASEAIAQGLAADGGLFVPERMPMLSPDELGDGGPLPAVAARLLKPFFEGDPLSRELESICHEALDIPVPLVEIAPGLALLELFHGPTAAFKDFGARFLAACLARLPGTELRTVLVATSGDTGGAVAAAFHGRPNLRVVLLYPNGRVSPLQEAQLTCWGGNVTSLCVEGDFDDCQRLVKAAFADAELRERAGLTSANSISIGRLLPQMAYYAHAALSAGGTPGFVVPTGNLGNALACLWARAAGLPIGPVHLAVNANDGLARFFAGEDWRARPTRRTLANAMDVGAPSNLERLLAMAGSEDAARAAATATSIGDETIRDTIAAGPERYGQVFCPHTATAIAAWEHLSLDDSRHPWIAVATAHPAKFGDIVEPLLGHGVATPPALAELLDRPGAYESIPAEFEALAELLR